MNFVIQDVMVTGFTATQITCVNFTSPCWSSSIDTGLGQVEIGLGGVQVGLGGLG